jgi:30S ribosomal protein S31
VNLWQKRLPAGYSIAPLAASVLIFLYICRQSLKIPIMGRGDKKTAKGKRFKGSYGKSRPASATKSKKFTVKTVEAAAS